MSKNQFETVKPFVTIMAIRSCIEILTAQDQLNHLNDSVKQTCSPQSLTLMTCPLTYIAAYN